MKIFYKTNILLFIIFFSLESFGFSFGFGDSVKFKDAPSDIEKCITEIFSGIDNGTEIPLSTLQTLSAFILSEHSKTKAWELENRWEAEGASIPMVLPYEFKDIVPLFFRTNTPDYLIYLPFLRFSTIIELDKFLSAREKCVVLTPKTNTIETGSFTCTESITPNLQSGACFSYTNTRSLIRGNINGNDILISMSRMHSPSSYSTRGIPVGPPENNLFYFSEVEGINLTGLKWARSQMYISRTMAIYVKAPKNQTVVMLFTWLAAGWNKINITKTKHIYEVLEQTAKSMEELAGKKNELNKSLPKIIFETQKMNDAEANRLFKIYCDYVAESMKKGSGGKVTSKQIKLLKSLYNKKTLEAMPMKYRKALILQEKLREILDKPTWLKKK